MFSDVISLNPGSLDHWAGSTTINDPKGKGNGRMLLVLNNILFSGIEKYINFELKTFISKSFFLKHTEDLEPKY